MIGMPVHAGVSRETVASLWGIQAHLAASGLSSVLQIEGGSHLALQRNRCVHRAIEAGARHLFFLDADVGIEAGAVERLRSTMQERGADVAAALYCTKPMLCAASGVTLDVPRYSSAVSGDGPATRVDIMRCRHVGGVLPPVVVAPVGGTLLAATGAMLIDVGAVRARLGDGASPPWFSFVPHARGEFPEDWHFCVQVQRAGGGVVIDTRIATTHSGPVAFCHEGSDDGDATAAWERACDTVGR